MVKRDKDTNEYLAECRKKILQCQTQLTKEGIEVTTANIKNLYLNDGLVKPTLLKEYKKHITNVKTKAT